jgi:hypothetical protein
MNYGISNMSTADVLKQTLNKLNSDAIDIQKQIVKIESSSLKSEIDQMNAEINGLNARINVIEIQKEFIVNKRSESIKKLQAICNHELTEEGHHDGHTTRWYYNCRICNLETRDKGNFKVVISHFY